MGKLARWVVLLIEFNIEYATKKMVKGRAVVEFLAHNAIEEDDPWDLKFHDVRAFEIQRWKMYSDGAVNARGAGLGVVLITLEGEMLLMVKKLDFRVTNNMSEYEACLFGLEVVVVAGAKELMVYGDSILIIQQALKEWKVKEKRLKSYVNYLRTLVSMKPLVIVKSGAPCYQGDWVMQLKMGPRKKPWFYDLKRFIENREYLEEATTREICALWIQARNYISHERVLYKRMASSVQLQCVTKIEAQVVMGEMQKGLYSDLSHIPPTEFYNLTFSWPFAAWGIDIVEAESFTTIGAMQMARFIKRNLIYRYEVPHYIVTDNAVSS
eukprot:XP_015578317.1 uncharacterized protein LOC107261713 [Ricinus communis]